MNKRRSTTAVRRTPNGPVAPQTAGSAPGERDVWTMRRAIVLPSLAVFTAAVWGWSIPNGFVFDDLVNVVANPWITSWRALPQAFVHHAAGFDPGLATSFYRPLMHVCYAIAYALAGPQPWAFHLVNVTLHVIAVLCVYELSRVVVERWSDRSRYPNLPLVAAVVFAVHPVHTEAVAWVAGITDLSYTVLGLAALIVYVRSFSSPRLAWLSGLLLLSSLLSKETAGAIVLFMALLEWIDARAGKGWSWQSAALRLAPVTLATAIYLVLRVAALGSFAPSARQHPHAAIELAATAAALFAEYLRILAVPMPLNVMRSIPLRTGFDQLAVFAGLLAVLALVVFVVRVRRRPVLLLPAAAIVLPVLPVLYVPAIESGMSLFGERYLYLPVLGLGWCLGWVLEEVRHRFPWGRATALVVVTVLVVASAATVIARNRVWANSLSLWTDAATKSPGSAAAQEGLCFALYGANRYADAMAACERAIALEPARVDARINHATVLLALGRAREAVEELDVVLGMRPNSPEALVNRGLGCMVLGRTDEAIVSYRRALELNPQFAEAHNDLGVALVGLGLHTEALGHFEQAVRCAPGNAEYRANLQACPR